MQILELNNIVTPGKSRGLFLPPPGRKWFLLWESEDSYKFIPPTYEMGNRFDFQSLTKKFSNTIFEMAFKIVWNPLGFYGVIWKFIEALQRMWCPIVSGSR
jgi:hypothetical protein